MVKMTRARKARLTRDSKGRFKNWSGGRTKRQLKKKENNFQGIAIHIGKEFKRQKGRKAKTRDIIRTKKLNGSYHKGAFWYIKTDHGWRKSPTQTRKPGRKTVSGIIAGARKGR